MSSDNVGYGAGFSDLFSRVSDGQQLIDAMNERFCTSTKCWWSGPAYRTEQMQCPLCGSDTRKYESNDGFLFIGPQRNKIWPKSGEEEIVDPNQFELEGEFIRPYNKRYHLGDRPGTLPKNFHYPGMNKIKAGKGYRKGRPYGVLGKPCDECEGTIISIQMCTSSKGFSTTSEKVCDTCGLVYPGSFQILDKPESNYKGTYSATHEEWKQQNMPTGDMDDVDAYLENYHHLHGGKNYGEAFESGFFNRYTKMPKRLQQAIDRLARTPESMRIPMEDRRTNKYKEMADDYIHMLELNKTQASDVHYIIDHRGNLGKMPYKMDDIIYHICLLIGQKDLRKYRQHNKQLYTLLHDRLL